MLCFSIIQLPESCNTVLTVEELTSDESTMSRPFLEGDQISDRDDKDLSSNCDSEVEGSSSKESSSSVNSPVPSELTFSESSVDIDAFLGPPPQAPSLIKTFKIVGDNVDKNIHPRDMRFDNQTRSLHYFHSYGVRDRVNIDDYSDQFEPPDHGSIELTHILPSQLDDSAMLNNFSILIARILKKYMPFFKEFGDGLERHIQHEYTHEMSQKSEVVSLLIY